MTLVKLVAMRVLAALKVKADSGYKDMNDWLGARFLKEMERLVLRWTVVCRTLRVISMSHSIRGTETCTAFVHFLRKTSDPPIDI